MRFLATLALCLFAAAAHASDDDHDHDDHAHDEHAHEDHDDHAGDSDHKATFGEVTLLHAWTPETEGDEALVFFEIDNAGTTPVTLLGGETDIAATVELVGFQPTDGVPGYVPLPKLPIAAGAEMVLAPNGVALRLTGVTAHLHEGEAFELRIEFEAGEVEMLVQVEPEGATQHSHAGHNH